MTEELAVSLGTSYTSVFIPGNGIVLSEPSVIVYNGDPSQRRVRAAGKDAASMEGRAGDRLTVVRPIEDGVIAGFADMTREGYLDRLYVHKDLQGRGIASLLCDALEQACGAQVYTVFSSVTARGFFEKRGYALVRRNEVKRGNETLVNFLMSKKR